MAQIMLRTEQEYEAAMCRIEQLLRVVTDGVMDADMWELDLLSQLASEYEATHYHFPAAHPAAFASTPQQTVRI